MRITTPCKATVDCDFLLSFHNNCWPSSAMEWLTRVRAWPARDVVSMVVDGGSELVPKVGHVIDPFRWRLSFSRAEVFLASQVGPKARLCYLALKIFFKAKLRYVCPFMKTYHLKTLFFYFMETKSSEYWNESLENDIFYELLWMLSEALMNKECPHYFIHELNLWESPDLTEKVQVKKQCLEGVKFLNNILANKSLVSLFMSPKGESRTLFAAEYKDRLYRYNLVGCILFVLLVICIAMSIPVILLFIILFLQAAIVWVIGLVCCFPLIALFLSILYFVIRC